MSALKELVAKETQEAGVMSSIDLREIINAARVEHQEPEVANRHFLARIEDELEGELGDRKSFTHPQNHKQIGYYDLTLDQCKSYHADVWKEAFALGIDGNPA